MKDIIKQIKKSKRVGIIAHTSPDPDCMSSMSALSYMLEKMGKTTHMFVDTTKLNVKTKDFYAFPYEINQDIDVNDYDTIITVDTPASHQLGKYYYAVRDFENTIAIDHHDIRDYNAKFEYNNPESASCSEIIFNLAKLLKFKLDSRFCSLIYSGIIGDTNCFENDNTSSNCLKVAADCLENGANKTNILFLFKKMQTQNEIALKKIGYNKMFMENQIAYAIFTAKDFKESGADECPAFVNELLNIDNNIFAFVIKQKEKNTYSVSLRCKEGYNVASIAQKFGGGGHIQAAGMSFVGAPVKHSKLLYEECLKQIKEKQNV
ncbi:MAG: bifunctional oligoribonuclease/PAP phosphatase NrnA [Clostridiales bacterium]|nr:bifunctional oligoribonuclease/PAP phosphatase NrnA [Clostridiales bacterium]